MHRRAQTCTGAPRRAQWPLTRPCRGQSRLCCSLHGRVAVRAPARPSACAPAPKPQCLPACPAPLPSAVSWPGWPCRGPVSRHSPAALLPQSRYKILYRDTLPSSLPAIQFCVLQYTCCPQAILQYSSEPTALHCIAIQLNLCNTISSPGCNTIQPPPCL